MNVQLHLGDCLDVMRGMADKSVDAVITDPPYLYLNHKLDRPFDEDVYFPEVKRILKPSGFHVSFGRGDSFYRWNIKLADLGFIFKEEIIWDKRYTSSPMTAIARCHETIAIYSAKNGVINKTRVNYVEAKKHDLDAVIADVNRTKSLLKDPELLTEIESFLITRKDNPNAKLLDSPVVAKKDAANKHQITTGKKRYSADRGVYTLDQMINGAREKSIIKVLAPHYRMEHPTQKPTELMVRLLGLVSSPDMVIFDPFMGSGTTGVACVQTGRNFIGIEIDPTYFAIAERRIQEAQLQPRLPLEVQE